MKPKFELAEILENNWKQVLDSRLFNKHKLRTLNAIRICRTADLGFHKDRCDDCGFERISYNSCRNRHCPKCQGKQREDWIKARMKELLPVSYFHVTFTIPHHLNPLCLAYPKALYNILFKASWQTIQQFAKDKKHLGAKAGAITILHTWGQNMSLHPHLHCIIPAGGVTEAGHWKPSRSNGKFLFPVKAISLVFRAKFVALLRRFTKKQQVDISSNLFDRLFEKQWVVYAKRPFLGPQQVVEYLGRYTHKIAISNHRITALKKDAVSFHYKDYKQGGKKKTMTLSTLEFLRRFSLHILPSGFRKIRHFGCLSNRNKSIIRKLKDRLELVLERPVVTVMKQGGRKVENPFLCPCCQKGQMVTVAVSIGIGFGRSPPKKDTRLTKQPNKTI